MVENDVGLALICQKNRDPQTDLCAPGVCRPVSTALQTPELSTQASAGNSVKTIRLGSKGGEGYPLVSGNTGS